MNYTWENVFLHVCIKSIRTGIHLTIPVLPPISFGGTEISNNENGDSAELGSYVYKRHFFEVPIMTVYVSGSYAYKWTTTSYALRIYVTEAHTTEFRP
jgi:hypothetical protein